MRSPHHHRNGDAPPPPPPHFHSTVAAQKLRRFNLLILVFRVVTFCFSLASSVFMISNTHSVNSSSSSRWFDFEAYRYVLAANAIVALYSVFEMVASVWEISRGQTLLPEVLQVWFDFSHDQVFAYMLLSANSAGVVQARNMKGSDTCTVTNAFCLQSDIAVALGFIGFLFLGFSSLISGFRVVCYMINGSRFHL